VRALGKTVDEPFYGELLKKLVEGTGGFRGLVEKTLVHRRGNVLESFVHYRIASR
jgi:hypothetical protein